MEPVSQSISSGSAHSTGDDISTRCTSNLTARQGSTSTIAQKMPTCLSGNVRTMRRFRKMRSVHKFAAVHVSFTNHFSSERHFVDRQAFKFRHSATTAEWRNLMRWSAPRVWAGFAKRTAFAIASYHPTEARVKCAAPIPRSSERNSDTKIGLRACSTTKFALIGGKQVYSVRNRSTESRTSGDNGILAVYSGNCESG